MAHLTPMVLGRDLDAESTAKILNVAQLTLASAAANDNEPMRKVEFDTTVTSIDSRLTSVENNKAHIDHVYVDTSSLSLGQAVATATWSSETGLWTFGTKELSEGDILILNAATDQDSDRSWILNGSGTGTVADFTALSTDVDAAIQAAIASVIGDAAEPFNTLGKIEDQHVALDARVVSTETDIATLQGQMPLRSELRVVDVATWTDNGDGTKSAVAVNPFNSAAVAIQVQSDSGSGTFHYHYAPEFDADTTNAEISITTASASLSAHAVRFLLTGINGL